MSLAHHATREPRQACRRHRCYRVVTADGLDGVLRVATLLRQRGYPVRAVTADIPDGAGLTTVSATVAVTVEEGELLHVRLERVPSVVDVTVAH